ncbi:hypothetical protein sos41_42720 [Alphaproteobacteria bacterium SO-S41]|nr:hypothetical protein sos41_42720 [Alphaproteobacteria bacterium SO-S41]
MIRKLISTFALAAALGLTALAAPGDSLGIPSIPNLRDTGGYSTADGARLREGLLYRSNQLSGLSDEDKQRLAALGLRTDFDLRTEKERTARPDEVPADVEIIWLDVSSGTDRTELLKLVDALKDPKAASLAYADGKAEAVLAAIYPHLVSDEGARAAYRGLYLKLAEPGRLPALVHCTAGKDRTGWAAAALLTLLGVPRETVVADYLRSNEYTLPAYTDKIDAFVAAGGDRAIVEALYGVKPSYLDAAFAEVEAKYGSIEGYFTEGLGIDLAQQQKLREVFLTR